MTTALCPTNEHNGRTVVTNSNGSMECAVLDFLRMLGVDIELRAGYVQLKARYYRSLRWR